eukprot:Nk52_evm61s158 gene=Nk52_evmTU61s158
MVRFIMRIKANLENVKNLRPCGRDFRYYFKLQCMNCGEENPNFVYVCEEETSPLPTGRGQAHLVSKCKLCARDTSVEIIEKSSKPYSASGEFRNFVELECRGVEPIDYEPRVGFVCEGEESDLLFEEVDLSEKEWVDYDEKKQCSVGIYEFESMFCRL